MKRFPAFALVMLVSMTGFLLSTPAAYADSISLTLTNPTQGTTAGHTLSYFATVSAPITNTGTEFLNGDTFSVSAPATLDDSGYVVGFPLDLTPGQSFSGLLFTLTFPALTKVGDYPGSFSITGGPNSLSSAVLATVTFDAHVTPEPSTWLLLGTGLIGLAFAVRGRWKPLSVRSS